MEKVKKIPLSRNLEAIIDARDFRRISRHKWHVRISKNGVPYAQRNLSVPSGAPRRMIMMHRELLGNPDCIVDHINGNTLDNRRSNLRPSDSLKNAWNSYYGPMQGIKKIRDRWYVRINKERHTHSFGGYEKLVYAKIAHKIAHKLLFGKYSYYERGK